VIRWLKRLKEEARFPKRTTAHLLWTCGIGTVAAFVFVEHRGQIAFGTLPALWLLYGRWKILEIRWKRRGAPKKRAEDQIGQTWRPDWRRGDY
jgi:hypothetical protein